MSTAPHETPSTLNLMPGIVIVGAQWGDEGKGKITDLLRQSSPTPSCASQGGNNAGHTIIHGEGVQVEAAPHSLLASCTPASTS